MAIEEILFHEITEADIRKINASSNNANTGGGARDLRFAKAFAPVLDRLFPPEIVYEGRTPYRVGSFEHVTAEGETIIDQMRYAFQPTTARPNEIRIAQINKTNSFLDLPDISDDDGVLFFAFIRRTCELPQYFTEKQIGDQGSNPIIASRMREALYERRGNKAVVFSVDLL